MTNCGCRPGCTGLAIVASLIVGIITAFLQFTAVITITPAFLWVVLGVAVVYLALTLFSALSSRGGGWRACVCAGLPIFLIGILGAILVSIILLGIPFAVGSVLGAIFSGALLAFLALIVTTAACLALCAAGCQGYDSLE